MSYINTLAQYRMSDGWNEHLARGSRGGIDYATGMNTPILAPIGGRLENRPDNGNGFGNYIRFHHGNGFIDEFLHLNNFVGEGNYSQGQVIGYTGNTGNSTGPHVHWHLIHPNGSRVNPLDYVGGAPAAPAAPVGNNVVQPGDGYWHIAERVWGGDDATVAANMNKLIELNGAKRLYAGDTVILDAPAPAPTPAPTPPPVQPEPVVPPVVTPPAPEKPEVVVPEKPAKPTRPSRPTKPIKPVKEKVMPEMKPLPDAANSAAQDALGILIPKAKSRKMAYAIYGLVSLVVSNAAVGLVASGEQAPAWLIVLLAVVGNLAAPFATLAIANAGNTQK